MMTSTSVQSVTGSYDDYVASIRHARLHGFIVARESRPWSVSRCSLGRSVLEHGEEGAPFVASGVTLPGTTSFYLSGSPGLTRFTNGLEVGDASLVRWADGEEVSLNVPRPGDWYALTVPHAVASDLAAKLTGGRTGPASGPTAGIEIRPDRLVQLRSLAAMAFQAAEAAGPGGLPPQAEGRFEQALLAEVLRASDAARGPAGELRRPRIDRRRVLARLDEVLALKPSDPLYVADLCAATGLPERTLRHIVVEQYGTSPMRLLRSRRLCQLREALLAAADGPERVSAIAGRHGFWHMGQLAADYRQLFGELPSETRRRARRLG